KLCPTPDRVYCVLSPVDDIVVEGVFDVSAGVRRTEQQRRIRFVFGKERFSASLINELIFAEFAMLSPHHALLCEHDRGLDCDLVENRTPGPGVSKPECREHMQPGGFRA